MIERIATSSIGLNEVNSAILPVPGATQDADLLLFFGSCDGSTGFSLPTGFTELETNHPQTSHTNLLAYKVASSEPDNYTIVTASGNTEKAVAFLAVYRGADTTTPIPQSNSLDAPTANRLAAMTSITPAVDNSAVVIFVGTERGNNENPITDPAGELPEDADETEVNIVLNNQNGPPALNNSSAAAVYLDIIQTTALQVSGNINLDDIGSNRNTWWSTAAAVIAPLAGSEGSAAGTSTAAAFSGGSKGLAVGTSTATGISASVAVGSAAGTSTANALSGGAAGSAAGTSTASAESKVIFSAAGSAEGTSKVLGVSFIIIVPDRVKSNISILGRGKVSRVSGTGDNRPVCGVRSNALISSS